MLEVVHNHLKAFTSLPCITPHPLTVGHLTLVDHRYEEGIVNPKDLPLTVSVERAGELLGIGRRTAYRAAATGELPTVRIGRRLLVPTARLMRLLGLSDDADSPQA